MDRHCCRSRRQLLPARQPYVGGERVRREGLRRRRSPIEPLLRQSRVLVVDDEVQIREAVGRALSARRYEVFLASDGEEALAQLKTFEPDLVILDLNLPGNNGFDVCSHIRKSRAVPILVLSMKEDQYDEVEALDFGADDLIGRADVLADQAFQRVDQVPLEEGPLKACNVLAIRCEVIVSGHHAAHRELEQRGYRVHRVDLSEFVRADGGPNLPGAARRRAPGAAGLKA